MAEDASLRDVLFDTDEGEEGEEGGFFGLCFAPKQDQHRKTEKELSGEISYTRVKIEQTGRVKCMMPSTFSPRKEAMVGIGLGCHVINKLTWTISPPAFFFVPP